MYRLLFAILVPYLVGTTSKKQLIIDNIVLRQSYKGREIDKLRWICGKDNPTDVMTKASPNSALERIISTNKATIGLKR